MTRVGPFTIGGVILSQRKRERILRNDRERTGGGTEGKDASRATSSCLHGPAPDPAQFQFDGFTQTTTPAPLRCHVLYAILQGVTSLQVMSASTTTLSLVPTRPRRLGLIRVVDSWEERRTILYRAYLQRAHLGHWHAPRYNRWKVT
jgi:hypothetical protein